MIVETMGNNELNVRSNKKSKTYSFDRVFGSNSSQKFVYETSVQPLVDEVLAGFSCTVFAYGQTGTGKTHTMEGVLSEEEVHEQAGIIPRSVHAIFQTLESFKKDYSVKVSFLELYNEELLDLLAAEATTTELKIFEDIGGKKGIVVQGLEEIAVDNAGEVFQQLQLSQSRRRVAETKMNKNSSRSHCIFTITIHTKETTLEGEDVIKIGKLHLVDLAGSECVGRSGVDKTRATEAGNINKSLLTLGRVITALVDRSTYVPYRDSKLTRLLQESLGGRSKTVIIATVSPAALCADETQSTLDYASRAKSIKNKPQVNVRMTNKAYMKVQSFFCFSLYFDS
jgi:kinesin family protein 11